MRYDTAPARFRHLLQALHGQHGQRVAVLVDEYDKPILDALETPEVARANRDYLRGLCGVIKDSDAHVRLTFLTGISTFSKVSLFSQLNNLTDLTLDRRYSAICGYTERDLDTMFAPELAGLQISGDAGAQQVLDHEPGGEQAFVILVVEHWLEPALPIAPCRRRRFTDESKT